MRAADRKYTAGNVRKLNIFTSTLMPKTDKGRNG